MLYLPADISFDSTF